MGNKNSSKNIRRQQEHVEEDTGKVTVKRRVLYYVMYVLTFCVLSNVLLALGWLEYEGWKINNFDFGYSMLNIFLPLTAILFLWLLTEDG